MVRGGVSDGGVGLYEEFWLICKEFELFFVVDDGSLIDF